MNKYRIFIRGDFKKSSHLILLIWIKFIIMNDKIPKSMPKWCKLWRQILKGNPHLCFVPLLYLSG